MMSVEPNDGLTEAERADVVIQLIDEMTQQGVSDFNTAVQAIAGMLPAETEALADYIETAWDVIRDQNPDVGMGPTGKVADVLAEMNKTPEPAPAPAPADPESTQAPVVIPSKATSMEVLVPRNLSTAFEDSIKAVEAAHGPIDAFVAKELGYKDADELVKSGRFAAEQIASIALEIHNHMTGGALVIGHQTGIGKGRIVAGVMVYALRNNLVPVFVTDKPTLYQSMLEDLQDIGLPIDKFNPLPTNVLRGNDAVMLPPAADGTRSQLFTYDKADTQADHVQEALDNFSAGKGLRADVVKRGGATPTEYHAIFTTYDQNHTEEGALNRRNRTLLAIAPRAFFVLDESHKAGGSEASTGVPRAKTVWKKDKRTGESTRKTFMPIPVSTFFRQLLGNAGGVMFSSATWAKRPSTMSLYARTDIRKAVSTWASFTDTMKKGGIPLQQVVSAMLARVGQYVRFERDWKGIEFRPVTVKVDKALADSGVDVSRAILAFSELKEGAVANIMNSLVSGGGRMGQQGNATGNGSVSSINFSSLAWNVIEQLNFAMKIDSIVDQAKAEIAKGRKPVIAVSSTMESALDGYAEAVGGLKDGADINVDFRRVLQRYLDRTREVTIKPANAPPTRHYLTDGELGAQGVAAYELAKQLISESPIKNVPLSPIDYLKAKLKEAGLNGGEITGRQTGINYGWKKSGDVSVSANTYYVRKDTGTKNKRKAVDDFNNGAIDYLILNQSGATGLSLHSSAKVGKDTRPRSMLVAQAERDIDTFMQIFGRIHRTGQIHLPAYQLILSDVPSELRPAAVLLKKLASLNANVTGDTAGGVTLKVPDIMNEVGDQVVAELLGDDPELDRALGQPLQPLPNGVQGYAAEDGAARKISGRANFRLHTILQDRFWNEMSRRFDARIAELDAMGKNPLAARTLDLQARTLSTDEIFPGNPADKSPFATSANLVKARVKSLGKPHSSEEVLTAIRDFFNDQNIQKNDLDTTAFRNKQRDWAAAEVKKLEQPVADYVRTHFDTMADPAARQRAIDTFNNGYNRVVGALRALPPGTPVTITDAESHEAYVGVVMDLKATGSGNPVALSRWTVKIAVADGMRQLSLPLTRIGPGNAYEVNRTTDDTSMMMLGYNVIDAFDGAKNRSREDRYIGTGNLLAAFDQLRDGQIINYTDQQGNIQQGVIMPKNFDPAAWRQGRSLPLADENAVWTTLNAGGSVTTQDNNLTIRMDPRSREVIFSAPNNALGRTYATNAAVRRISAPDEFISSGGALRMTLSDPDKVRAVVRAMLRINPMVTVPQSNSGGGTASFSIEAWHGTPHTVDRFDLGKIGTGEGSQAYGYGLYFASQKQIGEFYKNRLTNSGKPLSPEDIETLIQAPQTPHYLESWLITARDINEKISWDDVMMEVENRSGDNPTDIVEHLSKTWQFDTPFKRGNLYQVELAPREDELLDYDKSISSQSPHVKDALRNAGFAVDAPSKDIPMVAKALERYFKTKEADREIRSDIGIREVRKDAWDRLQEYKKGEPGGLKRWWESGDSRWLKSRMGVGAEASQSGRDLYDNLALARGPKAGPELPDWMRGQQLKSDKNASEYLRSLGIRGIKFLDGSSRNAGKGSSNYVIFDDKDVAIKAAYSKNNPWDTMSTDTPGGNPEQGDANANPDAPLQDGGGSSSLVRQTPEGGAAAERGDRVGGSQGESLSSPARQAARRALLDASPNIESVTFRDAQAPHEVEAAALAKQITGTTVHFFEQKMYPGQTSTIRGMVLSDHPGEMFIATDTPKHMVVAKVLHEIVHELASQRHPIFRQMVGLLTNPAESARKFQHFYPSYEKLGPTKAVEEVVAHAVEAVVRGLKPTLFIPAEDFAKFAPLVNEIKTLRGGPKGGGGGASFSKNAPPFFLKSEQLINAKMGGRMAPLQLKALLENNGVKPDEMKWMGLDDYLKAAKGPVTKEEVLGVLRANDLGIQEVVKGGDVAEARKKARDDARHARSEALTEFDGHLRSSLNELHGKMSGMAYNEIAAEMQQSAGANRPFDAAVKRAMNVTTYEELQKAIKENLDRPQLRKAYDDLLDAAAAYDAAGVNNQVYTPADETKFGTYQLPGGSNYREVLVTMPVADEQKNHTYVVHGPNQTRDNPDIRWTGRNEEEARRVAQGIPGATAAMRNQAGGATGMGTFRSSHWDEPNVLAHMRLNDRTSTDGLKLLHGEEFQDDRHNEISALYGDIEDAKENGDSEAQIAKIQENIAQLENIMPMTGKTHEMMLRRLLRMAVEGGYDGISWTPGDIQRERYNLAKQVQHIAWEKNDDGTYNINAPLPNGDPSVYKEDLSIAEVKELVGKDVTKKIMAGEGAKKGDGTGYRDWRILEGKDLTTGGFGKNTFYDEIIPTYLNKYGKRWNAKVSETTLSVGKSSEKDLQQLNMDHEVRQNRDGSWEVYELDRDLDEWNGTGQVFDNKADADAIVNSLKGLPEERLTVPYFPIPDQMRQSIEAEGQPMFARGSKDPQTSTPEFRKWFGDSKVVDENGEPAVAIHYTTAQFQEFSHEMQEKAQRNREGPTGYTTEYGRFFVFPKKGFFFFVGEAPPAMKEGAAAMPVYLAIKNPLDLRKPISPEDSSKIIDLLQSKINKPGDAGNWGSKVRGDIIGGLRNARKNGMTPEQLWNLHSNNFYANSRGEIWDDILRVTGHDGILMDSNSSGTSLLEPGRGRGDGKTYLTAIAIHPTQIKSAIANTGAFDPENPNVMFSREDSTLKTIADDSTTLYSGLPMPKFIQELHLDLLAPLKYFAQELATPLKVNPPGKAAAGRLDQAEHKAQNLIGQLENDAHDAIVKLTFADRKWLDGHYQEQTVGGSKLDAMAFSNYQAMREDTSRMVIGPKKPKSMYLQPPNPRIKAIDAVTQKGLDLTGDAAEAVKLPLMSGGGALFHKAKDGRFLRHHTPVWFEAVQTGAGPLLEAYVEAIPLLNPGITTQMVRDHLEAASNPDPVKHNRALETLREIPNVPTFIKPKGGDWVQILETDPYRVILASAAAMARRVYFFEQFGTDHDVAKLRADFVQAGGKKIDFDLAISAYNRRKLGPVYDPTSGGVRAIRAANAVITASQLTTRALVNIFQTAMVPTDTGVTNFLKGAYRAALSPRTTLAELAAMGAMNRAIMDWSVEEGRRLESYIKIGKEIIDRATLAKFTDIMNNVLAGAAFRELGQSWKRNGLRDADLYMAETVLGLLPYEIANAKRGVVLPITMNKIVQNGVKRTQFVTESPHRASKFQHNELMQMLFSYQNYAIGSLKWSHRLINEAHAAFKSGNPARMARSGKRILYMLLAALGVGLATKIMKSLVFRHSVKREEDSYWKFAGICMMEAGLLGPAQRAMDAWSYSYGSPEKAFVSLMPKVSFLFDLVRALGGLGPYAKETAGERAGEFGTRNVPLLRAVDRWTDKSLTPQGDIDRVEKAMMLQQFITDLRAEKPGTEEAIDQAVKDSIITESQANSARSHARYFTDEGFEFSNMDVEDAVKAYEKMTPEQREAKLQTDLSGKLSGLGKTAHDVMREKVRDSGGITEAKRAELVKRLEAIDPQGDWLWKRPRKI